MDSLWRHLWWIDLLSVVNCAVELKVILHYARALEDRNFSLNFLFFVLLFLIQRFLNLNQLTQLLLRILEPHAIPLELIIVKRVLVKLEFQEVASHNFLQDVDS